VKPVATLEERRSGAGSRPRRYLDLAQSYADVARLLAASGDTRRPSPPLFMLVAHAMELALKAVIAGGRCDDEGLILLGHDLPLCLRVATNEGLDLKCGRDVEAMVEALAMPHLAQAPALSNPGCKRKAKHGQSAMSNTVRHMRPRPSRTSSQRHIRAIRGCSGPDLHLPYEVGAPPVLGFRGRSARRRRAWLKRRRGHGERRQPRERGDNGRGAAAIAPFQNSGGPLTGGYPSFGGQGKEAVAGVGNLMAGHL